MSCCFAAAATERGADRRPRGRDGDGRTELVDRDRPERFVGSKTAWVNVSREFVLSGLARAVPPGLVGLEILEDELLDDD